MKTLFVLLALLYIFNGCSVFASSADTAYPPYITDKKLHATNDLRGKKAPELQVAEWVNGHAPKTKGKVTLLEFWATWCPDCHRARPILNKFAEKFGDDLVIIGISDESVPVITKFLDKNPVQYHIASAPDRAMYKTVGVTGIPLVLVVSADGIVRWEGYIDSKEDLLTEEKLGMIIKASKEAKSAHTNR
ncbi:MAG TPA: TlpA disulfide reductase family protein [Drouetiella sp.]|jgi:cytochrome c biogenesis protein CcmG, thiol:disulfide interchange protein DsbE